MKNSITKLGVKEIKEVSGGNFPSTVAGAIISGSIYLGMIIISKWLAKNVDKSKIV